MDLQLTAVFRRAPEGYVGFLEELPGGDPRVQGWTRKAERALKVAAKAAKKYRNYAA